jgi:hypothetical protein
MVSFSFLIYRGSKRVAVAGAADKRNYTANMACSAAGDILPPQLIFEGKKKVCS